MHFPSGKQGQLSSLWDLECVSAYLQICSTWPQTVPLSPYKNFLLLGIINTRFHSHKSAS
jgi:hypothetical protein